MFSTTSNLKSHHFPSLPTSSYTEASVFRATAATVAGFWGFRTSGIVVATGIRGLVYEFSSFCMIQML
jgi:hypothetical protein